ncbi:MAG: MerR family transcriptional regulator [Alphaproteobacteria bacterium]|nr:MerR family transcriptional regulator [Alphaproteobacteria bacterium]MCY4231785.1 MerR family transcriptional regulator [Alphaproteobacteria bacterium]MCY4317809.1 MerR family transcriptional regulator [Alphaproteobacteria bacterium]
MEKHPTAYRTISEVAREVGLEPHVLRFWESKFPQLQPLKRAGGRRYYRPEDVETILSIRELLHERRFTIKGARRALSGQDVPKSELRGVLEELRDIRALMDTH